MKNIKLRSEPLFEILIYLDAFEIKNEKSANGNGIFRFSKTDSLRIENRTNWLITLSSFSLELITSSGGGGFYEDRDLLLFYYNKEPIKITLHGCDLDLAKQTVNHINQKIGEHK